MDVGNEQHSQHVIVLEVTIPQSRGIRSIIHFVILGAPCQSFKNKTQQPTMFEDLKMNGVTSEPMHSMPKTNGLK